MNRPIKFRAWQREEDEYYSRMVTSEQSVLTAIRHVYNGTGIATGSGFSDINNQPNPDRYTLMQYTGLKDRNGVEIYEGDILYVEQTDVIDPYIPHKKNVSVRYEEIDTAFVYNDKIGMAIGLYTTQEEIEVVGNIFEHPHLLEGDPHAES